MKKQWQMKMRDTYIFSIEELRENWDDKEISEAFVSGSLLEWLKYFFYDDEAEKLCGMNTGKNIMPQLKQIFGLVCDATSSDAEPQKFSYECVKDNLDANEQNYFEIGKTAYNSKDYDEALKNYTYAVMRDDDSDALARIAAMYGKGYGVGLDLEKSLTYYIDAARLGCAGAMNEVGEIFMTRANLVRSIEWYQKAVDNGDTYTKNHWKEIIMELQERGIAFNMQDT